MNRVFDERLELQLQEYEFAELDLLLSPRPPATHPVVAGMALQAVALETGRLDCIEPMMSANDHWNRNA